LAADFHALGEVVTQYQLGYEKRHIDQENDDCRLVPAGHKRSGKLTGTYVYGARPELNMTIRADTIGHIDECPAIRAHAPFFHRLIVTAGRKKLSAISFQLSAFSAHFLELLAVD
jgi:hypothetical protein